MEFQHLLELPTVKLAKLALQKSSIQTPATSMHTKEQGMGPTSSGIPDSPYHVILTNTQQFKLTNNGRRKIKETEGTYY